MGLDSFNSIINNTCTGREILFKPFGELGPQVRDPLSHQT